MVLAAKSAPNRQTALLAERSDLLSVEVLRRLRELGYEGGKSAAYEMVALLRAPPTAAPLVRFEGLAGEFSQHDFGSVAVAYDDGTKERLHFFASRLKYSRFAHVRVVADERVEALVRALLESFEVFGGVPLVSVFDNPKTVVIRRHGSRIEWNTTFGQAALDLRFAPELCWPHRPQEKGAVENLVGWVKGSFFKQRVFNDIVDLHEQLVEWQHEVNEVVPCRATGVTPRARMAEELPRLRPVKLLPSTFAVKVPVLVRPDACVVHEGQSYQLLPKVIGRVGTLYLMRDRVRVVVGSVDVVYRRPARGDPPQKQTTPQLKVALIDVAHGPRGKLYLKRQQLLELGQHAHDFLTELVHRKPRTWKPDVERLHALSLSVEDGDLRAAFRKALDKGGIGAEYVAHWLKQFEHARSATLRPSVVTVPVVVAHESGAERSHGDDDGDGGPLGSTGFRVRAQRSQRGGA